MAENVFLVLLSRRRTPQSDLNTNRTNYKKKFAALKTNLERVNFVYEELKKYNLFPPNSNVEKNDDLAIEYRELGNKYFRNGNHLKALENYTQSVAFAKTDTILALAYANRSNCLFKLHFYEKFIEEIDRAFGNKYDGQKKELLIKRRKDAEKSLKSAENYYEEIPKIPDDQKNSLIQCANKCITIKTNQEFGRHVVATRNIQIGEVLSVEKPYACVLREGYLIHCHNCLELCYNLLPCKSCTKALYCSEECREKAQAYHKYECPILCSIFELGFEWILIPLKVALLAREDYDNLSQFQCNQNVFYRSDRYTEIHNLQAETKKGFDEKLFLKALSSAIVFHLIKTETDFCNDDKTGDIFKEIFLLQIQVAQINGINIYEYVPEDDLVCYKSDDFAGGIYSFSCLYNHSCIRNVFRAYHGSTLVIRAVNTIKEGEQCFINYGSHYDISSKWERQLSLSKDFSFNCSCKACEENWEPHFVPSYQALGLPANSNKALTLQQKMSVADVPFAKQILPKIIESLKSCEAKEPWGCALTLKRMLGHCYETLGNKRRLI